ncbi:MAG: UDP-N-acetylmuramoyl-tripeptide-D-alanyl-D-alanine ligase [Candidatus Levybacteria bacterium GW2011_GWC2_40_7]|nr:MAG: UDP-N-acetylmuramoyl-tripeptide-D-alanyl-D-alanine ligase [Candidatus Levybacteria bacterium GW2011_GWC2_40_7]
MKLLKAILIRAYLNYLKIAAKIQIAKFKPIIVGIGGASGKTSTASLLYLILSEKFPVLTTRGKNSETGIPLSILGLEVKNYSYFEWIKILILAFFKILFSWKKYKVFIAEMGIDSPNYPKNMSYLLSIVQPKIGIITNIAPEHSVYFESLIRDVSDQGRFEKILDLIGEEELMLLKSIKKDGFSIINIDDKRIKNISERIQSVAITVSKLDPTADYYIESRKTSLSQTVIKFIFKNKEYVLKLKRPLPTHYDYSLVFSIIISHILGIPVDEAIRILERKFNLPAGRVAIFKGIKNSVIIDSSYNSSIETVSDLLELLSEVAGNRRRIAIIGDMREQGLFSKTQHEELAKRLVLNADVAILIGPMLDDFAVPILSNEQFNYYSFPNFSKARARIRSLVKNRDIILVKGSQNTLFLERAVEMLLTDPEDQKFLPRRGKFWDKMRTKTL